MHSARMTPPRETADRHRAVAATFTTLVESTSAWDAPAPVDGWTARDVVAHLVDWFPAFLTTATGLELDHGRSPLQDPVDAWRVHSDAVQRVLDGPDAATPFHHPMIGEMPLPAAVGQFYVPDVFMHSWDLAAAGGQDLSLDADYCAELVDGMRPIEELMRSSGQYGPAVAVPDDADDQTRLLGFIGRDPHFLGR